MTFRQTDLEKIEVKKKAQAAGTPGPAHKALDPFAGDWKAEVKCWMGPDHTLHVSEGTARARWIMSGRFLQEDFEGEIMGQTFKGRTILGYDNTKQTFNSVWFDDVHTSMFTSEGKGNVSNKTITLEGKSSCAVTGRKEVPMLVVLTTLNRDKHVFEMFDLSTGEEVKSMEITYTRE